MSSGNRLEPARTSRPVVIGWSSFLPIASAILTAMVVVLVLRLFARAFAVFILSVAIADCFSPIVARMERHMNRTLAAAVIYTLVVALLVFGFLFVVPPLTSQIQSFLSQAP